LVLDSEAQNERQPEQPIAVRAWHDTRLRLYIAPPTMPYDSSVEGTAEERLQHIEIEAAPVDPATQHLFVVCGPTARFVLEEQVDDPARFRAAVAHVADDEERHRPESLEQPHEQVAVAMNVADDRDGAALLDEHDRLNRRRCLHP
jgi:hypothetical protein